MESTSISKRTIRLLVVVPTFFLSLVGQVSETSKRYVKVGTLQSYFSAWGSERAWNNIFYEGLRWPADYPYQDNSVIKRSWIALKDFEDESGYHWDHYGLYFALDYTGQSIFPMELKQSAKFLPPTVYVDGIDVNAVSADIIDEVDPDQKADRIITNIVNTSIGLTMTRKIYVFTQEYHDNYFIKEFTFTNTGNTDWDEEIELSATLNDIMIGWGTRYSCGREGTFNIGDGQSWGKHTWVTKRGEDYSDHMNDMINENDPIVDWLRCGFSWAGQTTINSFNNIGAPDINADGRLTSPHHVGSVVLHVDKSTVDRSDDPDQPAFFGWHAGDTYPRVGNLGPSDELNMVKLYDMLSGTPYEGLGGSDRLDETIMGSGDNYLVHGTDPFTIHNDAGGTNVMMTYGPFDIGIDESITIVEAEGINGLSREKCEEIGKRWKMAYDNSNDTGPFSMPDGEQTNNKNIYKNSWVFTGKDSILETFGRAKRNYDSGMNIPQPPLPPIMFNVSSGGDRIYLSWEPSPSETDPDFAGYKIFRALGKVDTTYDEIFSGWPNDHVYEDITAVRGFSYYYYVVAFNNGSNNTTGEANPVGPLMSNRFYTRTTFPAYLRRKAGDALSDIRIVPNPYHISSTDLQYPGERNKIMFLNIPPQCRIKIFTERGDLIRSIDHRDGSGDETWNSISSTRQLVTSGLYIANIEVTEDYSDPETGLSRFKKGESATRKFLIIR